MSETIRYRVNTPDVIDESVDGEVLIVHLGTGIYYSAQGTGDIIWRMLAAGHSTPEALDKLGELAGVEPQSVAGDVEGFVAQLTDEGLLVAAERDAADGTVELQATVQYSPPTLHKYTDMEALLLLDPVHDVDEGGWPVARTPDDIGTALRG